MPRVGRRAGAKDPGLDTEQVSRFELLGALNRCQGSGAVQVPRVQGGHRTGVKVGLRVQGLRKGFRVEGKSSI